MAGDLIRGEAQVASRIGGDIPAYLPCPWQSACFCKYAPMQALEHLQKIDRSQNIDGWNVRIYFASRDPHVLMGIAAALITIALGIAWFVQKPLREMLGLDFKKEQLQSELNAPHPDVARVLQILQQAAGSFDEVPADEWIVASNLDEAGKLVAGAYWTSLMSGDGFEPSADLLYYAHYVKPLRHSNELIGDHYAEQNDLDAAAGYYRREAGLADARTAQEKLALWLRRLR